MREVERRKQLGNWGEAKVPELLMRFGSGFANPRDVNEETHTTLCDRLGRDQSVCL